MIEEGEQFVTIPDTLVTFSIMTLLIFGFLFGILILALFTFQTQNIIKGETSSERTRRMRSTVNLSVNQSS